MSDLDLAKALRGASSQPYARVHYGTVTDATQDVLKDPGDPESKVIGMTAEVRVDGWAEAQTMACETKLKRGDRVHVVTDPTGRYFVYGMRSQMADIEDEVENSVKSLRTYSSGLEITNADDPNDGTTPRTGNLRIQNTGVTSLNGKTGSVTISRSGSGIGVTTSDDGSTISISNEGVTSISTSPPLTGSGSGSVSIGMGYGSGLSVSSGSLVNSGVLKVTGTNGVKATTEDGSVEVSGEELQGAIKAAQETADEALEKAGTVGGHGAATCAASPKEQGFTVGDLPEDFVTGEGVAITGEDPYKTITVEASGYAIVSGWALVYANSDGVMTNGITVYVYGNDRIAAVGSSTVSEANSSTFLHSASISPAVFDLREETTFKIGFLGSLGDTYKLDQYVLTVERWA